MKRDIFCTNSARFIPTKGMGQALVLSPQGWVSLGYFLAGTEGRRRAARKAAQFLKRAEKEVSAN